MHDRSSVFSRASLANVLTLIDLIVIILMGHIDTNPRANHMITKIKDVTYVSFELSANIVFAIIPEKCGNGKGQNYLAITIF